MSSDKDGSQNLPDGWVLCQSKSIPGRTYFFNKKTGKSSWSQPQNKDKCDLKISKKEKLKKIDKRKKEELPTKGSKRKSDRHDEGPNDGHTKRSRHEENKSKASASQTKKDCKRKHESPKKETSSRSTPNNSFRISPNKTSSPSSLISPTVKNLASNRLSQLREQLAADVAADDLEPGVPPNKKNKSSPPIASCETPQKSKTEHKSPTSDSKSSQSPNNDSVQSIPSPSQFFAANKILSSMKAQLPDEYFNTDRQKDTFADIEKGICNQVPEYPSLKHPSTPPQFSEASKLMSAIKSKLTYKVSPKDDVKTYTSAKSRMEQLRANLSADMNETDMNESNKSVESHSNSTEAMETEDIKEEKLVVTSIKKDTVISGSELVVVVDTNIFIHELDLIKNILNSYVKGHSGQPTLLIPWRVINELDRLKDNNNGQGALCKRAKSAMDYLYKALPENNRLIGQPLRDANSHIYPCEIPDDEILNCALQQVERGKNVLLLSNDKNLCNKATINSVRYISVTDFHGMLEHRAQAAGPDPALPALVNHCQQTVYKLLANILENEMRAHYNNLWQHILFKAPPWSLADVLQCLLKHWIAVFNEVFPRIEPLINDLKNSLMSIERKDRNTLTHSEVAYFKELCLDVSKRCQIIPEYMELAKRTVEGLERGPAGEGSEQMLVQSFETLWTVLSSYGAKLCNALGLPHSIEDKVPGGEPATALIGKWAHVTGLLNDLTLAIKDVVSEQIPKDEHLQRLEGAFNRALAGLSSDDPVSPHQLRLFVSNSRNLLEEAFTKFSQLIDLLNVCKNSFSDIN